MSVRSLRTTLRRSPALAGAAVLSASLLLAGCGDDVVDDGVEQEVGEDVEDAGEEVEDEADEVEDETDENDG